MIQKEFIHSVHYQGSFELSPNIKDKKISPKICGIKDIIGFISLLEKNNYKISKAKCTVDFDEYRNVPLSKAKNLGKEGINYTLRGNGLEIFLKPYHRSNGLMGGPFDDGIQGTIGLQTMITSEFDEIEDLIKGYFKKKE